MILKDGGERPDQAGSPAPYIFGLFELRAGRVASSETASILSFVAAASALKVIHVLFTGANMPGPNDGIALAHHATKYWPDVSLVVTSAVPHPKERTLPVGCRVIGKSYDHEGRQAPAGAGTGLADDRAAEVGDGGSVAGICQVNRKEISAACGREPG